MGPGLLSTLHFLASMLRRFSVAIMAEKRKVIFLLDSGVRFSVLLSLPVPGSITKVVVQGKFGQPLEC
jgi:hypothetical protein